MRADFQQNCGWRFKTMTSLNVNGPSVTEQEILCGKFGCPWNKGRQNLVQGVPLCWRRSHPCSTPGRFKSAGARVQELVRSVSMSAAKTSWQKANLVSAPSQDPYSFDTNFSFSLHQSASISCTKFSPQLGTDLHKLKPKIGIGPTVQDFFQKQQQNLIVL
jgi:hypothetical protein